ncbi:hypothetical protein Tsubulata_032318 [Turnera subulata]|uniref:Stress enhanced protein 2 n=1 Tax=Turnera subulata TaxID=218843 RepID=A0A9Q0JGV3_9ROSI|nr:hypothetical protein Tsubulata_032318 [Turnera subulata]
MARVLVRAIRCEIGRPKPPDALSRTEPVQASIPAPRLSGVVEAENSGKLLLQPRLCTLRSYGEDRFAVVKSSGGSRRKEGGDDEVMSRFFETLSDYIESSKKSRDFEIISGRLAMIVFAATVTNELVTGNSVFRKMDLAALAEGFGVCLAAVAFAAVFAWFSSARTRVGTMFTLGCNTFIDSLIDDIVDGLFYDIDPSDWSDEI